jgi:hypothetical protein
MGMVVLRASMSLDGFMTGPDVGTEHPMGRGGERLHEWLFDESEIQLVPVLLGGGTRLFDHLGPEHIELERTAAIESPHVTHLRFDVVR